MSIQPNHRSPTIRTPRTRLHPSARSGSNAQQTCIRRSLKVATRILKAQAKNHLMGRPNQFIFISHSIDHTGAPLVLLEIIDEFVERYGSGRVLLLAPDVTDSQLEVLRHKGVEVFIARRKLELLLVNLQLALRKNDLVLMNTVAIPNVYRRFVIQSLTRGRLAHAFWFIHEDEEHIPYVSPEFFRQGNTREMAELVENKQLSILVPTKRTKQQYDRILGTDRVTVVPPRVQVDKKYQKPRPPEDFTRIAFLITGAPADGRKAQLVAISALYKFLVSYYRPNDTKYRDFSLYLVGVGTDYVSQQIRCIGESLLGERLKIYPPVTKDEVLDIYSACNVVICCSLNETFGLYVAEGMFMGHVVLRNSSSGAEEQLQEGKNGYRIDSENIDQFAAVIERILNTRETPNSQLKSMSDRSQQIIRPYEDNTYIDHLISTV